MAKKNQAANQEQLVNLGGVVSNAEDFFVKYKKVLIGAGVVIALGIGGYVYYLEGYMKPRQKAAEEEIYMAEYFFRKDSLNLALNGVQGQFTGLISIADNYGDTRAGNRAKFLVGTIYLHQGKFEDAITYLKKYNTDDLILSSQALGCIGDAHRELGDSEKAASYYEKAYKNSSNEVTTPYYMKKAAMVYEDDLQAPEKALKLYTKIREDYGYLSEYKDINKYIAKLETSLGN